LSIKNDILSQLKKDTNCSDELCVIKSPLVSKVMPDEDINLLIKKYFKPKGPSKGEDFLSNYNIDETLEQFKKKYINRSFLHIPFQMRDFETIKSELATVDLDSEFKEGIKTFGCVLNTDNSYGGGIHWFCIFGELLNNKVTLEYFNSSGRDPLPEVSAWLYKTKHYLESKIYKVEIKYRDVHSRTLTNDVQYFPPKERVY